MIDIQTIINITIFILAALLVILTVQSIIFLKDLKVTLDKVNKILDDTSEMSQSVKEPIVGMSKFLVGLKSGMSLMNIFKKLKED